MKANVEKLENNKATLKIEVDRKKFDEALEKSYKKNVKKINIPGFRKGKAPRKLIEARYGEEIFYEDAVNFILPEAYQKAVEDTGIEPVSQPDFDIVTLERGEPLVFTAEVTVKPEVNLGEYKGFEVEKNVYEATEESVEQELEKMRQNNARLTVVDDRPAQEGDVVTIDFEGTVDGEPFEGGKATDYQLELGSKTFIPGFEEQIAGLEIGEEKQIKVTFPENYGAKDLAGKEAEFKVNLKEIKQKQLPELDDEFAKDVSEFETLQELKQDVKNKLIKRLKDLSKAQLENEVIKKAVENAEVDIPEAMVDNNTNNMINEFAMRLRYQGLTLDKYMEMNNLDMEDLKNEFKDESYNSVKTSLVLEAIAEKEGIEAEEKDVEEEIEEMAEKFNQSPEDVRKRFSGDKLEKIKERIVTKKTIDFLVESSKIVEKKVKSDENEQNNREDETTDADKEKTEKEE